LQSADEKLAISRPCVALGEDLMAYTEDTSFSRPPPNTWKRMQRVLLPPLNSPNMGLHLVLGDGNLRTAKTAVIFNFGGIFRGILKIYQKQKSMILNIYVV